MSEWNDLVKALDDFVSWGDYFFKKERIKQLEEKAQIKMKWEFAEDSDFEVPPKKKIRASNLSVFVKSKVVGGWLLRMYNSIGGIDREVLLRDLNRNYDRYVQFENNPPPGLTRLQGKWFISDNSCVNGKFVGNWDYNSAVGEWIWVPAFEIVENYDYDTEMDVE